MKLLYAPELGTQLHINWDAATNRGQDHALATVAGVNADETVNLHVFANGPGVPFLDNVPVFPSEAAARGDLADPETESSSAYVAWWPPGSAESNFAQAAALVFFAGDLADGQEQDVTAGETGAALCSDAAPVAPVHGDVAGDATCTVDSLCTGTDGHHQVVEQGAPA